ncbi:hypothetical protein GCM10022225_21720 [Plantactinospora mayteni]|uniref:Uncharacterized protein n=1 Tax=Plantactinospora mayteni TaxID=566021 RepID=A0ABQ4ENY0_9ACTN|nr:hypothetical protein Pma05_29260 [Plantactinospora mayteni]
MARHVTLAGPLPVPPVARQPLPLPRRLLPVARRLLPVARRLLPVARRPLAVARVDRAHNRGSPTAWSTGDPSHRAGTIGRHCEPVS